MSDQPDELRKLLAQFTCPQGNFTSLGELQGLPADVRYKTMGKDDYYGLLYRLSTTDEIDYLTNASLQSDAGKLQMTNWMTAIHPHAPFRITTQIRLNWPKVKAKADQWLAEYGYHPAVALALAEMYDQDGDADRAEKLYNGVLKVAPDDDVYFRLVEFYWNRKRDRQTALKLAEEYLEQEDYGLSHAELSKQIAYELMSEGKDDDALPWAERAASSYAAWGLSTLADCYERLDELDQADEIYGKIDARYDDFQQYGFAVRTGHGDLDAAYQTKLKAISRYYKPDDPVLITVEAYHAIAKEDLADALAKFQKTVEHQDYTWLALWAAALADRTGDAKLRDAMWQRLIDVNLSDASHAGHAHWKRAQELARVLRDASEKGDLDLERIKQLSATDSPRQAVILVPFFTACWFDARGEKERALEFYRDVARVPMWDEPMVFIAWARLRQLGDDPHKLLPRWYGLTQYVQRKSDAPQ